ncbi:Holliday junction resolvase RuvX [Candidatus Uhrbacteria bacterium]|nr:Holliday junction resolvase RuvX [Candidatus Uhrbacteria bacterium]
MRFLGIDYGDKRTGLAVSDDAGRLAVPFGVVEESAARRVIERIEAIVGAEAIDTIVVGVPLSMRQRREDVQNRQYAKVQQFIDALRNTVSIPIATIDERLSTVEAERQTRGTSKNVRAPKDAIAASIILQSYLDRLGH